MAKSNAQRNREFHARKRQTIQVARENERKKIIALMPELPLPGTEWRAIAEWAESVLKVPSGPLRGKPFHLDQWQIDFLRASTHPRVRESGLSVARKNGKSALIAVVLLAYLAGPLRRQGFRGIVTSLTGRLAVELWNAMYAICNASGLEHIEFKRTPQPGIIVCEPDQRIDFLAADRSSGHALGADIAIIDEAGLLQERDRDLWNAILSSVSGRDGRLMCISIRGDGPMFSELADRSDDPAVSWTEFAGDPHKALDDPDNWHAANPGLSSGIKSNRYMEDMARRAMASPNDRSAFSAYDLNLPQEPSRELILSVSDWQQCVVTLLPPREGKCLVGIDLGGSSSMTCVAAYWPETGRFECWGAFPAYPDLRARGEADGVGGLYIRMMERGELSVYPGRITNLPHFFDDVATRLAGESVLCAMDRYRKAEAITAMEEAGLVWPVIWRGMGHSHTADGSADVRAFQKMCMSGKVQSLRSLMLESAIAGSSIVRDAAGNPKLDKSKNKARIDALQASVLALGLGSRHGNRVGAIYHGVI